MTDDDAELPAGLFDEPDGYFPPAKPHTVASYRLLSGEVLSLRLVGHNPLWGHLLWNAGQVMAEYLERRAEALVHGRDVLELGAGAGLPGLVCSLHSAAHVVVTDYPDADLIDNLRYNIDQIQHGREISHMHAEGYLWGSDTQAVSSHLGRSDATFDLLILADLLFNHSEHAELVATISKTLKRSRDAQALVFFTPYRPWLLEKDLAFFPLAEAADFHVEKRFEKVMDHVMFEHDPGEELLRRTVFGYELRWNDDALTGATDGAT
ncbi:MAG: nicotinamide n-methyltransferase [Thelocarpon superellum]|nr:MAG: nicotinamide n-methyltransferase [Thelocarpon superellum]